jgi:hypothetical protein
MRICDLLGEADFPGTSKPADGPYIESFNIGVRQECLNQQRFLTDLFPQDMQKCCPNRHLLRGKFVTENWRYERTERNFAWSRSCDDMCNYFPFSFGASAWQAPARIFNNRINLKLL